MDLTMILWKSDRLHSPEAAMWADSTFHSGYVKFDIVDALLSDWDESMTASAVLQSQTRAMH